MFTPSSRIRGASALAVCAFLWLGAAAPAAAQEKSDAKPEKRKQKREIDDVFKRWLKEDVSYIISPEERAAFSKLATDEEREAFIEQFWVRRDPDPNTPENEYREEHYRRIAYANEHFSSGIPGWRTDRGRVYIAWGKPDSIDSNPTGSTYERPQYEGGGSTTTYAYEVWWYRHLDGVGDGVELEFVDPTGTGEFRIALDGREKDALQYVPNAGPTDWEQLGLGNKYSQYGANAYAGVPHNKTPFAKLQTWTDIQAGPGKTERFRDLRALTSDLPTVETNALPFAVRTDFYRISDTAVATSLTVQLDNSDLSFKNSGGVHEATVNVYGVLTQLSGKGAGRFEEVISTPRYSSENLALGQQQKSAYQKVILLPPGNYKIDIVARDVESGRTGLIKQSFVVPRYSESKLGTSSIVVAQKVERVTNRVAARQFDIGRFKVIPNVSNAFRPGQPVTVFFQLYDTQEDQTTLKPTIDIEYVVLQNGKEVRRVMDRYPAEDGKSASPDALFDLAGKQLAVGRQISSEGLAAGSYTLQVRITDRVAQKTLTPEVQFTILQ